MRPGSLRRALVCSLVVLFAGCGDGESLGRVAVGAPAPAYAAPTLEGDSLSLASLEGQPVLLNIWATWCHPCREEMPGLQALHEAYAQDGLRVVGVSIDQRQADAEVQEFLQDYGIDFTILRDPQERVTRTFRTTGVPETFLIDREGQIAARWIGQFDPMSEDARAKIREAVAQPGGRS